MFTTPKISGQQMANNGRRTAMTQKEIDALKVTIASITKAKRPFVLEKPAAPEEEVQRMIVLTATNIFERQEYLTLFAPAKF